jgi:UDPglucose 6-dehydrogenase
LLVRRNGAIRHLSFAELFADVDADGADGWEVLSWRSGEPTPEFLGISTFTARPWSGELVEIKTKMGRRVRVTPDHPLVLGDGRADGSRWVGPAGDVTPNDWMPVAQEFPLLLDDFADSLDLLEGFEGSRGAGPSE